MSEKAEQYACMIRKVRMALADEEYALFALVGDMGFGNVLRVGGIRASRSLMIKADCMTSRDGRRFLKDRIARRRKLIKWLQKRMKKEMARI